MKLVSLTIVLLAGALSACRPTELPAEALAAYVDDPAHDLHQVQQVAGVNIQVTYQPIDLLVSRELQGQVTTQAQCDSLRRKYAGSIYFLLSLSRDGKELLQPREGFTEYSALLQTLAFRMNDYTRLVTSQGDTLRPANYYLDRTYASASSSQLLFAFPQVPLTGTWQFQVRECGLGIGNVSFPFEAKTASSAPTLAVP